MSVGPGSTAETSMFQPQLERQDIGQPFVVTLVKREVDEGPPSRSGP